jgi:hypothetical protein
MRKASKMIMVNNKLVAKGTTVKEFLKMSDKKEPIFSGQLFFRKTEEIRAGKKVYVVCGVVGIINDEQIKNEHQYTISALKIKDPIDKTAIAHANTPDGILCEPIWRV